MCIVISKNRDSFKSTGIFQAILYITGDVLGFAGLNASTNIKCFG
jgi:hypothetical protein